ncbi:hypothetical protein CPAST_c28050 [Clostridium pasteurianum DSM 525 = ATCC 6013]|uniref:Nucleoside phosphorylase domain-containing protein n=1 Tax=Clostridium pasteurianum DSM 525 = ATCC 6013 TaxID=1262449 RepID=A0A0H3J6N6_CLOPA|nr:hypothetical protein [Clostridium pasteurianum]AJA48872.1 hypothetical protein CPAST_c28050 [Clostridium pasteurianum DSM 525 = ATCC 6013]AJA52860.1 hypothetical protein CLPA_c28050 [Clostridium pasteurianum DSM 525 = ATCC 6013]AOZ76083.1 hypothetical protein AQ983_13620 [Clostridium pasteurianum DSM 525 = ATCC 6013]AOZ79879.1 hypothetical protein AQ984_13615 [Clostridium pasteurianum]ELP60168.1 hypothetical protein F502_06012 [Clostridium pasteurianum DSM 525 = ATCC 6013]
MIYFLTALYYEAKDIIFHYNMKKSMESTRFQVFKGKNEILIISGTGYIKSVAAVTYLLNCFGYNENDIFIDIGICGSTRYELEKGKIILCNKLIDNCSKKSFYPDMLFKHPFNEGTLESFAQVVEQDKLEKIEGDIVDQEGAFVYQAASIFAKPHNIHIIKIVSDILNPQSVTPEKIERLFVDSMQSIYIWLEKRVKINFYSEDIITEEEYNVLKLLSENIKLTSSMKMELNKLSTQYEIRNGNVIELLKEYTKFQCKSKNEGKKIFEQVKNRLMEL